MRPLAHVPPPEPTCAEGGQPTRDEANDVDVWWLSGRVAGIKGDRIVCHRCWLSAWEFYPLPTWCATCGCNLSARMDFSMAQWELWCRQCRIVARIRFADDRHMTPSARAKLRNLIARGEQDRWHFRFRDERLVRADDPPNGPPFTCVGCGASFTDLMRAEGLSDGVGKDHYTACDRCVAARAAYHRHVGDTVYEYHDASA